MSQEVAQALLKCVDVLEERGWCQGSIQDVQGRVCALGAINVVKPKEWDWTDYINGATTRPEVPKVQMCRALAAACPLADFPDVYSTIATYNNHHCHSTEDVIQWFKQAAYNEEQMA